jgi:hypothetical protein
MHSNSLDNPARPRLALSRAEGPALPACAEQSECALPPPTALPSRHPEGQPFRSEGSRAIGTGTRCFAALRAGGASPDATPTTEQGRAQELALSPSTSLGVNSAEGSLREQSGAEKPSFLIATRAYSRQELTHCKQRATTLSNRHKIAFFSESARMESRQRFLARLGR